MSDNRPVRKALKVGNNARGNAVGMPSDPKSLVNRTKATASVASKSTYARKGVDNYSVQKHPGNRSSEGSALTPGSANSGSNIQPFARTKPQNMSKLKKGVD